MQSKYCGCLPLTFGNVVPRLPLRVMQEACPIFLRRPKIPVQGSYDFRLDLVKWEVYNKRSSVLIYSRMHRSRDRVADVQTHGMLSHCMNQLSNRSALFLQWAPSQQRQVCIWMSIVETSDNTNKEKTLKLLR